VGKKTAVSGISEKTTLSDHLVARYEELRQHFRSSDIGMGLNLFLHHGMKVWMDAWSRYAPVFSKTGHDTEEIVPVNLQSDMTVILAGMVLHAWQKERRC
jgi:hypothetical protein